MKEKLIILAKKIKEKFRKRKLIVLGILAAFVLSATAVYAGAVPYYWYNKYLSWDGRRLVGWFLSKHQTHTHSGAYMNGPKIGTAGLANGAVTREKVAGRAIFASQLKMSVIQLAVAPGTTSGSTGPVSWYVGGEILGFYPATNQDQFVDSLGLNPNTGNITITLAAPATAENRFNIVVAEGPSGL